MSNTTRPLSRPLQIRRNLIKALFRGVFRLFFRIKITGKENIPTAGAYLIAHNHVSIVDPALVLSFWPANADAIGTEELWSRPGQNIIVRFYGTTKVGRQRTVDREFLKQLVANLRKGRPLVIAPEGKRSHQLGMLRAEPGIAYLADQANVSVLPVSVLGSLASNVQAAFRLKRPLLEMRIGAPFKLPDLKSIRASKREARQKNADLVMRKIAEMLPAEYWGAYNDAFSNSLEASQ